MSTAGNTASPLAGGAAVALWLSPDGTETTTMDMTSFRPADASTKAISEAIERANVAQMEMGERFRLALLNRDMLLLDGDAPELAVAEKNLAQVRGDAERIEAVLKQLKARLEQARKDEAVAEVRTSYDAAQTATDARRSWWEKNGKKLKAMLQEASSLHENREDAVQETRRRQLRMAGDENLVELFDVAMADRTEMKDLDAPTYRLSEKLSEAWRWCASIDQTQEVA